MSESECKAEGGQYKGDNTKCTDVDCTPDTGGNGPPPPDDKPSCGDGLVWAAALALGLGIIFLALSTCGPPVLGVIGVILIVLSAIFLALWVIFSFILKCKLDWCAAAAIFTGVLATVGTILIIIAFALPCMWPPIWKVYGGAAALWGFIAAGCLAQLTKK